MQDTSPTPDYGIEFELCADPETAPRKELNRIVQDRLFESDFDRVIKQIEAERKPGNKDK